MKKSLWKNNFKVIIKTRRRFISILIMAFLGVGFFAGLVATGPDMQDSFDKYADDSNLFDVDIVSTLGLVEDDVDAIREVSGVDIVQGVQTKDTMAKISDKESVCKVIEYNEKVNVPEVVYGRLPENSNECLLDYRYSIIDNISDYIGKTVVIENDDTDSDGNSIFAQKELVIVGIAESPLYISNERGNTSIGNGTIGFYIYTRNDVINLDYYTNVYAKVTGIKGIESNSDEYWNIVNPVIQNIEKIKTEREEARYNQLINDANSKLNDAQAEFDKKKLEVDTELLDAENKINDAKNQVSNSEKTLNNSELELNAQEANAKKQFEDAERQISVGEEQISNKKRELENGKLELATKKNEANQGLQQIDTGINEANARLVVLQNQKKELEMNGLDTTSLDIVISKINSTIASLEAQKKQIQDSLITAENQISYAENEIAKAEVELQNQKSVLNSTRNSTKVKIENGRVAISNGRRKLENAKEEIAKNEAEFVEKKQEAISKIEDAQTELNNAKEDIDKIEKAKWYIRSRKDNLGCTNIIDAIKTLTNISKLFPVIFYLVAVLISLTSMTRMIEEERTEIGTLKALGYTNLQIIIKYVLYAFLACMIGGLLGMTVGFYLIPTIVWNIYSTIYTIPEFCTVYRLEIGLQGLIIAFLCIGGATIFVAVKELKNMPSVLMRPKAPKNGKKIFLEKCTFFWKRLNFSKKVTTRNIFRYKKRAIMTIVGIAGCTGLMVTGFGIRDSVLDIPESQYGKIFTYDMSISLSDVNSSNEVENIVNTNDNIVGFSKVCASSGKIKGNSANYDTAIFVPDIIPDFEKMCHLNDSKTNEKLEINDDGIVISDKLAELAGVKAGDNVILIDSDNLEYSFKVTGIAENYVSNYVYMSRDFYETNMRSYNTNMFLIDTKEIPEDEKNNLSELFLNISGVASVTMISDMMSAIEDMLGSLNYVVIILIVASALLAFVVLYNLANINIGERKREIATLKVLGFYDKEVDNYINKENMVFTAFGVIIGLVFGYFLTDMVVASVEIDKLRFIRRILPLSYVVAAVITIVFSLIVNYIIHFVLKKIDMIESLKSVE